MAKAKGITGLDCAASVAEGARLALQERLNEMCAMRASALDWSDPEGVHDMRVASRRLRSALSDFTPYLDRRIRQKRLKAVAGALGAVRDEDVAIMALEQLAAEAEGDIAAGIEQLAEERRWRREHARAALTEAISEEALDRLQQKFTARLARATRVSNMKAANGRSRPDAEISFQQSGAEIILTRFAELRNLSKSLYHPLEPEPLHRMRIAAKRLRYAIELFAQCWGEQLMPFTQEISELQTSLGELHDCDVWIADFGARLSKRRRQAATDGSKNGAGDHAYERVAAIWLLRRFVKERTKHFRDALARWHEWETNGFAERLSETLKINSKVTELDPVAVSAADAVASDLKARQASSPEA